jgi:hypothetical protein
MMIAKSAPKKRITKKANADFSIRFFYFYFKFAEARSKASQAQCLLP